MGPATRAGIRTQVRGPGLGGRGEAARRHNWEVLGTCVAGSPYRLVTGEVRREERAGEETVVVRFRLAGDGLAFGFRIGLSVLGDPCWWEDPITTYEVILVLLDEAVLVGQRSAPDPEGVVWAS